MEQSDALDCCAFQKQLEDDLEVQDLEDRASQEANNAKPEPTSPARVREPLSISENGEHFYTMTLGFLDMKRKLDEVAYTCLPRDYMARYPSFKDDDAMLQVTHDDQADIVRIMTSRTDMSQEEAPQKRSLFSRLVPRRLASLCHCGYASRVGPEPLARAGRAIQDVTGALESASLQMLTSLSSATGSVMAAAAEARTSVTLATENTLAAASGALNTMAPSVVRQVAGDASAALQSSTTHAMAVLPLFRESGLMHVWQRARSFLQDFKPMHLLDRAASAEGMFQTAQVVDESFQVFIKKIATEVGLSSHQYKIAPLKSLERSREKVRDDYEGNWRKLVDLNRASIIVSREEDLIKVADCLTTERAIKLEPDLQATVVRLKNRFKDPLFNGYRDALYSVRIRVPETLVLFVCEIQVHLDKIIELKTESHVYYEFFRSHFAGNMDAIDDRMRMLMQVCSKGAKTLVQLTQEVTKGGDPAAMEVLEEFLDMNGEYSALSYVRECRLEVTQARSDVDLEEVLKLSRVVGQAYDRSGRVADARAIYQEAYNTYKAKRVGVTEEFCSLCNCCGWVRYEQKDFDSAEEMYLEALEGYDKLGIPKCERALATRGGIALLRVDVGRFDEGIEMYRETLRLKQETLGREHIGSLTTATFLAMSLRKAGQDEEAEELANEMYNLRKAKLGADHPQTLLVACELAALSEKAGRVEEAIELYNQALKAQLKKLGADHAATIKTLAALERLGKQAAPPSQAA